MYYQLQTVQEYNTVPQHIIEEIQLNEIYIFFYLIDFLVLSSNWSATLLDLSRCGLYFDSAYRKSPGCARFLHDADARSLSALRDTRRKDAAVWMEEEEEVRDWKAKNRISCSGKGQDAVYGSPPASLRSDSGVGRFT